MECPVFISRIFLALFLRKITFTKLLLVTQTNLGAVVDLSAHKSILVQGVFAANSESSLILRCSPSQIDSGFQTRVHLLVNRSSENLKKSQ